MGPEHVWWCVHPATRAVVAAHVDGRTGQLKELPLTKCIEAWGWDPMQSLKQQPPHGNRDNATGGGGDNGHPVATDDSCGGLPPPPPPAQGGTGGGTSSGGSSSSGSGNLRPLHRPRDELSDESVEKLEKLAQAGGETVRVEGLLQGPGGCGVGGVVTVPRVPPKFLRWLRARQGIYREIANMAHLGATRHENVVGLLEVLEYVQDTKSTLFLVLELVTGGELFDRICIGKGTTEATARRYFRQLVDGMGFCHDQGVCHRDLKPEK